MKTLIKTTIILGLTILFTASCSSKKQNCDAYGPHGNIEISKLDVDNSAIKELNTEEKS